MKTLVLYTSNAGNTEAYAKEIAEAVGADCYPLKKFKAKKMEDYDIIVYGGWVMGGTIQGIDKFLQNWDSILSKKDVIVFSVGMMPPSAEGRHLLISQNVLDLYHIRFYQIRGGFDYSKLRFPHTLVISNSLKAIKNDPDSNVIAEQLLTIKETPIVYHDDEKVAKIVSVIKTIENAPKEEKKEEGAAS